MSKAKRLNEMIMMVNRKKRFTVGELAQEFEVSKRTILRDLQELSEMVPLYSEVGPQIFLYHLMLSMNQYQRNFI